MAARCAQAGGIIAVLRSRTGRADGRGTGVWSVTRTRRSPGRPRLSEIRVPSKQAIADAAARLFMEKGYRAATMEMVAEAAGLTKAAVYYHFKDKATLVVAAAHSVFTQARAATEAILARPEPLRARLEAIARIVLNLPQPFTAFDAMMLEAEGELAVGFFGSRYERATPAEREYMRAMAAIGDEPVPTSNVAEELGRKPSSLSPARDGLIKKGLIYSSERGLIAFTVPHFGKFLRKQAA